MVLVVVVVMVEWSMTSREGEGAAIERSQAKRRGQRGLPGRKVGKLQPDCPYLSLRRK